MRKVLHCKATEIRCFSYVLVRFVRILCPPLVEVRGFGPMNSAALPRYATPKLTAFLSKMFDVGDLLVLTFGN